MGKRVKHFKKASPSLVKVNKRQEEIKVLELKSWQKKLLSLYKKIKKNIWINQSKRKEIITVTEKVD